MDSKHPRPTRRLHHAAPRRTPSEAGPEVSGPTLTLVRTSKGTNAVSRPTGILHACECAQEEPVLRKRTPTAATPRVNDKGMHGIRPVRVRRGSQRAAVEESMDDALMTLSRHPYFAGLPASLRTA